MELAERASRIAVASQASQAAVLAARTYALAADRAAVEAAYVEAVRQSPGTHSQPADFRPVPPPGEHPPPPPGTATSAAPDQDRAANVPNQPQAATAVAASAEATVLTGTDQRPGAPVTSAVHNGPGGTVMVGHPGATTGPVPRMGRGVGRCRRAGGRKMAGWPHPHHTDHVLPQRTPRSPDVPDIPGVGIDDEADTESAPAALARRIAEGLLRTEGEPEPTRPDGFDFAAVVEAVRQVSGVRDAEITPNADGIHTLKLDLYDDADTGRISREVARLLQQKMGLAAEPRSGPGPADAARGGPRQAARPPRPTVPAPVARRCRSHPRRLQPGRGRPSSARPAPSRPPPAGSVPVRSAPSACSTRKTRRPSRSAPVTICRHGIR